MRASRELRNALNDVYRLLPQDDALAAAAARVADLLKAEQDALTSASAGSAATADEDVHDGLTQERARSAEMWRTVAKFARLPADARHVYDR